MSTKNILLITGAGMLLVYFLKRNSTPSPAYTGPIQAAVPEQGAVLQPAQGLPQTVQNLAAALNQN